MKGLTEDALAQVVVSAITVAVTPLRERLTAVEQRLAILDGTTTSKTAKPRIRFRGAWQPEQAYGDGTGVLHAGRLWIARGATAREPGVGDDSGWQPAPDRAGDAP